jgi:hypothetical protein
MRAWVVSRFFWVAFKLCRAVNAEALVMILAMATRTLFLQVFLAYRIVRYDGAASCQ